LRLVGRVLRETVEKEDFVRLPYPPYDVLVAIVEGAPCAIEDACNHAGASLTEGYRAREGTCVACPLHGYVFELRTGKLVIPKGLCEDQRRFHAEVDGDEIVVWDPFEITIG
jgi:nitrite reductase/ring-hydroxylating ferredoxin subunit